MASASETPTAGGRLAGAYRAAVRALVFALAAASGVAILAMMAVTCVDVVLRAVTSIETVRETLYGIDVVQRVAKWLLAGEVDLVRLAGAVAIACALPYTTAVKGHVAIEYFFHKLSRRGRTVVDTVARLLGMALFGVLAWQSAAYGASLAHSGQVTATLQLPVFWVAYVIALACGVVVLVIFYNLLHPGKELIKP